MLECLFKINQERKQQKSLAMHAEEKLPSFSTTIHLHLRKFLMSTVNRAQ